MLDPKLLVLQILDLQLTDLVSNGSTNAGWPSKRENGEGQISYNPVTIILSRRQDASSDMPYAIIIAKVLQSVEEEDELVKDEDATEHEIVQDKKKVQTNGSGWASQVFSST